MLEIQEKDIDGYTFKYQPLMATPARDLLDQLVSKFGPVLASTLEGLDRAGELANLDPETNVTDIFGILSKPLGGAIRSFSSALTPGFHNQLVELMGKQSQMQDAETGNYVPLVKAQREQRFGTNLLLETKWIMFCLEVQYADFIEPLKNATLMSISKIALKGKSTSSSQKDSTGTSSG